MTPKLTHAYALELIGTFGLVFVSAGVVCVNWTAGPEAGTAPVAALQPGLVGIALAQGLILAALLGVTAGRSGGYLNPALLLALAVFGRIDRRRAVWLLGAQFIGGVLAAVALNGLFAPDILDAAQYGAPHLSPLAYPSLNVGARSAGTALELVLTFFLAFAIFGTMRDAGREPSGYWSAGAVQATAVLIGLPLTGAALNPARWFGPTLLQALQAPHETAARGPWADAVVYLAGPLAGALLAGFFCFYFLRPSADAGQ